MVLGLGDGVGDEEGGAWGRGGVIGATAWMARKVMSEGISPAEVDGGKYSTCVLHADAQYFKDTNMK